MSVYREFDIRSLKKEVMLNRFITVSPLHHNYALCIDYIRKWFMEKFEKDYFNFVHLDGSHVFGEINRLSKEQIISHIKSDHAILTISPTIDESYDRERIDMNLFGLDQYINTTKIDKAFFQDPINNKYIMMKMDMIKMGFSFKVKVPSRAMQLDLYNYMKLAFRMGLSETKDVDSDYLIPYPLILSIAKDCGFEIKDDRIAHPIRLLTYLNSRSYVPILYKRSNISDKEEYFIRMTNLPVHIKLDDMTKDDGDKKGHLTDNFGIEMNITVRFPSMQLYVYFSKTETKFVPQDKAVYNINNTLVMALHQTDDPPPVNDNGWNLYIRTDWEEDDYGSIRINMDELFEGELRMMIENHKKRFVSPAVFMDIQLFNDGTKVNSYMNWDDMTLECDARVRKLISTIAIYIDLDYLNTQRMERYDDHQKQQRVNYSIDPPSNP